MILGFKNMFLSYVEEGSKTHTIRAGKRWRAGMRADLFANVRQKSMRLLFRAPVVRVQEIEIREAQDPDDKYLEVRVDGSLLDRAETEVFFWRDGFRKPDDVPAADLAYGFWMGRFPFTGQIIHWDYAARFDVGGLISDEQLEQAILVYGFLPVRQNVALVPQSQRNAIEKYCYQSHLRAAENRVRVPKKPDGFDLLIATPSDWSEMYVE